MSKKFLFILYLLITFIPYVSYAAEYSLDDLYRLALVKSETIKIAEEDIFISEKQKDKAKAVLFPALSAFGSHTRYTDKKEVSGRIIQPEYTNEWGLRLDQSLSLSGREFTAYRIAEEGITKSMFDLDAVKEEYLLKVASLYYDLLKSKKALEIAGANVERLTKHKNAAETRLKVGEVTKTVVLRAMAELAGAQSELIKAEHGVRLSKATLARAVGIDGSYDVKETRFEKDLEARKQELLDVLIGDCRLSTFDCLKEKSFSERTEIKTVTVQKRIAQDEVKYTKGSYWPDLSIEGVYSRQDNEPSTSSGLDERIYGALKLNFPLFEGGLTSAEVGEAKAKLRQADHSLEDIKLSVGVEVEDSYLKLQTMSAVLDQLQAEVEYALDNYNAVTKQFQYGLADSVDIIDANTLLVTSERELANAEYDYELAILKLERATGVLLKTVVSRQ